MVTYGVRVCLDGGQKFEFENVTEYGINEETRAVYVCVNGYRQFFNFDRVLYVGRIFDLDENN